MDSMDQARETLHLARSSLGDILAGDEHISELEYLALEYLSAHEAPTVGEVKAYVQAMPSQMSRLVRHLEEAGLVTAKLNRQDKRKIDLSLTAKGRREHDRQEKQKLALVNDRLEALDDREREMLIKIMRKMAEGK